MIADLVWIVIKLILNWKLVVAFGAIVLVFVIADWTSRFIMIAIVVAGFIVFYYYGPVPIFIAVLVMYTGVLTMDYLKNRQIPSK
jgi:hypothetical protein